MISAKGSRPRDFQHGISAAAFRPRDLGQGISGKGSPSPLLPRTLLYSLPASLHCPGHGCSKNCCLGSRTGFICYTSLMPWFHIPLSLFTIPSLGLPRRVLVCCLSAACKLSGSTLADSIMSHQLIPPHLAGRCPTPHPKPSKWKNENRLFESHVVRK